MNKKIPKKLHFIWFGSKIPPHLKRYIALNKKMYKDFKIKVWSFKDFDPNTRAYTKKALEEKKYAFISDYLRTKILYEEGGIYLDTDMIPVKNIQEILDYKVVLGFEYLKMVSTGFVATEPNQPFFKRVLDLYNDFDYSEKDFKFIVNNEMWTIILKDIYGLKLNGEEQLLPADIKVYSMDYFSELKPSKNSYYLHNHELSWTSPLKARIMFIGLKFVKRFQKQVEVVLFLTEKLYFKKNKKRIKVNKKAKQKDADKNKTNVNKR